ncbi:surface antigen-domain-containing protein [Scheffersomyces amazonensis]|uniref:surface antigen-domain-containing protein n=1 Tax=Scheffersomyces amazonensis TaxID=1078765 RepID=UPI00315DC729
MSLDHEEDMIDRLSRAQSPIDDKKPTKEEQALLDLQTEKQQLIINQNKQFLEELFKDSSTQPIKIKNVQITNSGDFRDTFLQSQFQPLLKTTRPITLQHLLKSIESISKSFIKLNLVENLLVSVNQIQSPRSFFKSDNGTSLNIVPIFNIIPVKKFSAKTGTNIGNGEGDGYIQFQFRNLFGGAENLSFDATTGTKTKSSYLLNYNMPVFNNSNYINENLFYINTRKLEHIQSEVTTQGFSNKIFTQYDNTNFNHEFILENFWKVLQNKGSKSMTILNQSGSSFKSSVIYNLIYDSRDNSHLPSIGRYFRFGLEYSGLFKINKYPFIKSIVESQLTYPIPNLPSSIIFTNKAGIIYPLGQKPQTSVLDRFFIGGPNDVRSFTLNGLGPRDHNSSIGGDIFFTGGVSLISKIPGVSQESNFKLHNFINYGRLVSINKTDLSTSFKKLLGQYSVSFGFGLLYNHPMARFELNFVLPITANKSDSLRKGIQYGIGVTFL